MEKRIVNRGYTLIESIFVIIFLSMFLTLCIKEDYNDLKLSYNMRKIQNYFISSKAEAFITKQPQTIQIVGNKVIGMKDTLSLDRKLYCENYVITLNGKGNVDRGGHFDCYYKKAKKRMIIHIGSGNVYVQK